MKMNKKFSDPTLLVEPVTDNIQPVNAVSGTDADWGENWGTYPED